MIILALNFLEIVFILLINVKMPTIVGILTFMSRINFVLSWVEHEKSFITSQLEFFENSLQVLLLITIVNSLDPEQV